MLHLTPLLDRTYLIVDLDARISSTQRIVIIGQFLRDVCLGSLSTEIISRAVSLDCRTQTRCSLFLRGRVFPESELAVGSLGCCIWIKSIG